MLIVIRNYISLLLLPLLYFDLAMVGNRSFVEAEANHGISLVKSRSLKEIRKEYKFNSFYLSEAGRSCMLCVIFLSQISVSMFFLVLRHKF